MMMILELWYENSATLLPYGTLLNGFVKTRVISVEIDSVWSAMVWDMTIEPGSSFWEWFMVLNRLTLLEGLVRQPTKHRFYRAWVTVKPVGSAKSCRPKANPATNMLLRPTVQRNEPVR
ncbi:hypothetical protein PIB30_046556 [Stylosanthes scabra]|uniref:Uncharacterized protein n=1 Tax=Stylosanthes scabra TaxID=79078 RepID=A0ABU6VEE1_9FABA|nr:hypothetical protein [Stylosanthes scabra]